MLNDRSPPAQPDTKQTTAEDKFHPLIIRYFDAIGFNVKNYAMTLDVVTFILHHHGLTFSSTSLPANMQDPVNLEFPTLATYLLDNRYGYCFHHNIVAYEALKQLGFKVHLMAASIRIAPTFTEVGPIATHVAIMLTHENNRYLLDPGWGIAALKPLLLDGKTIDQIGYDVTQLADDKYALVEHTPSQAKVRYEFSCSPVNAESFQVALQNVMSSAHVFYKLFFYEQKTRRGDIQSIVNRKYTCVDAKGVKQKEFTFEGPARNILKSFFSLPPFQIERIKTSRFPNPSIRKIVDEFQMPKKVYQRIFTFLAKEDQKAASQVSKEWKEGRPDATGCNVVVSKSFKM